MTFRAVQADEEGWWDVEIKETGEHTATIRVEAATGTEAVNEVRKSQRLPEIADEPVAATA